MKLIKQFLCAMVLLCSSAAQAVIVHASAWHNQQTGQYIVMFGDWHPHGISSDTFNAINKEQSEQFCGLAKQCDGDCAFIVEDMHDKTGNEQARQKFLKQESLPESFDKFVKSISEEGQQPYALGITDQLKQASIDYCNVEFRYIKEQLLLAFLRHREEPKTTSFISGLRCLLSSNEADVKGVKISEGFNERHANTWKAFEQAQQKFNEVKRGGEIAEIILSMLDWTSALINIRIVEALTRYGQQGKKYIFICAGDGHIKAVESELTILGYKKIKETQGRGTFNAALGTLTLNDPASKYEEVLHHVGHVDIQDFFNRLEKEKAEPKKEKVEPWKTLQTNINAYQTWSRVIKQFFSNHIILSLLGMGFAAFASYKAYYKWFRK